MACDARRGVDCDAGRQAPGDAGHGVPCNASLLIAVRRQAFSRLQDCNASAGAAPSKRGIDWLTEGARRCPRASDAMKAHNSVPAGAPSVKSLLRHEDLYYWGDFYKSIIMSP